MDLFVLIPYLCSLGIKRAAFAPVTNNNNEETQSLIQSWIAHREYFFSKDINKNYFSLFEDINEIKRSVSEQKDRLFFCNAGFNHINIGNDGNFSLCPRFQGNINFALGSIDKGLNHSYLNDILTYDALSDVLAVCSNCFARNLCAGGCKARNLMLHNNINEPNNNYCDFIRSTVALSLKNYIIESDN